MDSVVTWLTTTHAYTVIRDVFWIIPTLQTIHILAICVVMSSVLLLNFRLVGIIGGGEAKDVFTRRYLPWVWGALIVLVLTGVALVVGEPERDLPNSTFWLKMFLLICAVTLTVLLEQPVLRNAQFWETPGRRITSRLLALVSISCWVGIVLCGRWIAYTY